MATPYLRTLTAGLMLSWGTILPGVAEEASPAAVEPAPKPALVEAEKPAETEPDLSPERWRTLTKRQAEVVAAIRKRQAALLAENPDAQQAGVESEEAAAKLLAEAQELEARAADLRRQARDLRSRGFREGLAKGDGELKAMYEEYEGINREMARHRYLRRKAEAEAREAAQAAEAAKEAAEKAAPEPEEAKPEE